jgi:hypothetical protein
MAEYNWSRLQSPTSRKTWKIRNPNYPNFEIRRKLEPP